MNVRFTAACLIQLDNNIAPQGPESIFKNEEVDQIIELLNFVKERATLMTAS